MRRRPVGVHRPQSTIPTSSMADVAFLLVVFFLVTTTFAVSRGLPLELPSAPADTGSSDGELVLLVHVRGDGTHVDCEPVPPDRLADAIATGIRSHPGLTLVVHAEADASYARMVEAYDAVRDAVGRPDVPRIDGVVVPTRSDLDAWTRAFGGDPFAAWCAAGR